MPAEERLVTRRQALRLGLVFGALPLLAACGGSAAAPSGSSTASAQPASSSPAGASAAAKVSAGSGTSSPGASGAAKAPAASPAAPKTQAAKLKVGMLGSASDSAFFIANDKGYFGEQGLDVELTRFDTGPSQVPALATGDLSVGAGSPSGGLYNAIARGIPLRIVADKGSLRPGFIYTYIVVRKDLVDSGQVKTYGDLKGRKVAINATDSSGEYYIDLALRRDKLTIADVNLVSLTNPDMGAGFANKSIEAAQSIEPYVTQWRESNLVAVLPGNELIDPRFQAGVVMYGPKFVSSSPDLARKFMVAYIKAVRDYNDAFKNGKDKETIINIMIKNTALKDRALYDKMGLPGLNPDGVPNTDDLMAQSQFYLARGYQKEKVDFGTIIDTQFADYAVSQLGKYSG